ncbi:alpha/beta hydrolase [Actinomyces sp. 2119]|uniref:Alpha/beta hydrolase n=1 Tax=Actinomyces lilanjuaniae TaxID=2321394 RepID=A0ABM6Z1C5_9ACTO|nr:MULTISPECIES: alpha/beta hydrolase [Actinomyces]AYD89050.1 alpha/beta hydrolase [Actinomyces lilanjuaniae]RJF40508.1 alpha/beta hydrolase [Actinomyces sp. 2119]RJF41831.1 alpha/beta hydrolase [Actinomyces sp. 2119]
MSMVRIDTPRGVTLVGSFVRPDGTPPQDGESGTGVPTRREGVVLLAHDFLADRHGEQGRLDLVSASYQKAGMATLSIDFSGLGESDDDVITLANEAEDLRAVSGWLAERGYTRQAIHANGFGATAALLARPEQVRTAVLVGAVVGPQSVLWEQVFSPHQLDELARHGLTRLVDDNPNPRQWNVLSKETLADFSMQEPHTTMAEVPWPVLMIYGALTHEMPDTAADAQKGFPLLKDGSQLVQVRKDHPQEAQAEVARLGTEWVTRHLR